ncbi:MAG: hypothetical protein OXD32_04455, partial [Endozoicomonadaceae bacterium]|nr:hypothetical protein [Endozoicomonadaceae bacterium]
KNFHHLEVYGVIDRDMRNDEEIKSLSKHDIFTLDVAEVENLFCVPEIITLVSQQLCRKPKQDVESIKEFVIKQLQSEIDRQVSLRFVHEVKFQLNCFNDKAKEKYALNKAVKEFVSKIDTDSLYKKNQTIFHQAIEQKNYLLILKLYNRKSLSSQMSKHFGLSNGELAGLVIRMAASDSGQSVKDALKPYFGSFAEKIT